MNWADTSILVTGGTGSFGQRFIRSLLSRPQVPRRIVVFSRDELKQHEMRTQGFEHPNLRFFIGDVRDVDRLRRAVQNIDVIVHAAALKQVPACEYNPIEAVRTNVDGARNVIDAALDRGVKKVLALSTDKAVNPVNLYGATKLVAEKLFVQANAYAGTNPTAFSCVRYGNVVGSRGSVLPLFIEQAKRGTLTITDPRMTRFWITLDEGVAFVTSCIERMHGGEVFVPKIPSVRMTDMAAAVAPNCKIAHIGIRPGEKLHEALISEDEARTTRELEDMYVVEPAHPWWNKGSWAEGKELPEGFRYTSDGNTHWLVGDELMALLARSA
jgi:UDP-N-acetylglucosamine 4,6-dehydratase/5-epimerase